MRRPYSIRLLLFVGAVWIHTAPACAGTKPTINADVQSRLTRSLVWRSFLARHGAWRTLWNERTGTPHRSFGPAISIPGFAGAPDPGKAAAALSFLRGESAALGLDAANLRLRRIQRVGRVHYLSFVQTYRGFEVLSSEVELRVHETGRLMAFGVDVFPDIDLPAAPLLTPGDAVARAAGFTGAGTEIYYPAGDRRPFVLPAGEGGGPPYRLVYRLAYRGPGEARAGEVCVDAVDGEIARIEDGVLYDGAAAGSALYDRATAGSALHDGVMDGALLYDGAVNEGIPSNGVNGSVSGRILPVLPTDTGSVRPFGDLFVVAGGDTVVTGAAGEFFHPAPATDTLIARLRGRWVYVGRTDTTSSKVSIPLAGVDTLAISWDDSNSAASERNAYYHVTFAHEYLKALDSSFTGLDYALPAAVNLMSGSCNAFWNGASLNFFVAGPSCVNAALSPATIYHEYCHAVNDRLYAQAGAVKMYNKPAHEGTADVFACLIEDTPFFARGFNGPDTYSRSVANVKRYPDDVVGEEHRDGLILAGAFWDLRGLTDLATARRLSHMAKWGTPDDQQFGQACAEWFVETLVADDDNGDLGDGTPHFSEIEAAFNAHGIGTLLFYTLSFRHTPYPATTDTSHDYILSFSLSAWTAGADSTGPGDTTGTGGGIAGVRYSTDGFVTEGEAGVTELSPGKFLAAIPPQPAGTLVRYYIEARDSGGYTLMTFPAGAPFEDSYDFLVGPYTTAISADLETPDGWSAGAPGDDATSGTWEWGQPEPTFNGWRGVQPGDDHTPAGTYCYVTGAPAGSEADDFDVDGGRTTLITRAFDLSALEHPVIRYYRWYSNNLGGDQAGDRWRVDISGDGGANWTGVENTTSPSNFWKKVDVMVEDYVPGSDSVMLRFVASDEGAETLVEALVDDLEVLTTNGVVVAVEAGPGGPAAPSDYGLGPNYPNPFNGETVIPYRLQAGVRVVLSVFDALGREVARPVEGRREPGEHVARWVPGGLPSGVYYYRLTAGTFRGSGKLLYVK